MTQISLWELSSQNHYAARTIQAAYRGHACRKILWSPTGILTQSRALLIQRVYRGHRGRQRAGQVYFTLITQMAMRMQRCYRCWKARRTYRILRAKFLNQAAHTIQHFYRTINTRRMFERMQERIRAKMATRLQKVVKGSLMRRRVKQLRQRIAATAAAIKQIIVDDLQMSSARNRMTLATVPARHYTSATTLLHLALSHLTGTHRNDFAVQLAGLACRQYNTLQCYFVYAVTLLCSWSSLGAPKLIREDNLAEAVGLILFLKAHQTQFSKVQEGEALDYHNNKRIAPPFFSYVDTIETTYFWNAFSITGTSATNLSYLACFLHVANFMAFGQGYYGTRLPNGKLQLTSRQKQLLKRAKDKCSITDFNSVQLRLQVCEHLFENEHELVVKQRRPFRELLAPQDDDDIKIKHSNSSSRGRNKRQLKQSQSLAPAATTPKKQILIRGISEGTEAPENLVVTADVAIYRCGDMVLVTASIAPPRESIVDNRPKWNSKTIIAPFITTVAETKQIYEFAVPYFVAALRKKELEIRKLGKWKLIGEFILQTCRIVSVGSKVNPALALLYQPTARVTLPYIEYRRRERNDLAMEEFSTKLLQRAFRGFSGRSLWRRLKMRFAEEKRQKDLKKQQLAARAMVKMRRNAYAATIQAVIKGYLIRKHLRLQHWAATVINSQARVKIARLFMARERFRRLDGPAVIEMFRKTMTISSIPMILVVYRSGSSFKVVGNDIVNNRQYVGYIHEPEVKELLERHNSKIKGTTRLELSQQIQIWQHEKVTRLLVDNLSLVQQITLVNTENGAGRKAYNMTFVCMKHGHGRSIQDTKTLNRVLADAEAAVPPLPSMSNKHQLKELLKLQKKMQQQA